MYKRKHPERFDAWWRPLTRQGDPSHRYDLVGEAFDAGYEAGKGAALLTLGRRLIEQYSMPHDADPPLGMEAHMAERLAQETVPECDHLKLSTVNADGTCLVCGREVPI